MAALSTVAILSTVVQPILPPPPSVPPVLPMPEPLVEDTDSWRALVEITVPTVRPGRRQECEP